MDAILTKIASKFQVTVPPEIRAIYGLQEGDLFQWVFEPSTGDLQLIPKRAQLITPLTQTTIAEVRARRNQAREATAKEAAAATKGKEKIAAHA
jgi:bifunctional DNA-binding transcriptional regulator/antitoxin component of YhaV-PrlF toxin-antitoxin module